MKVMKSVALAAVVVALSGCATVINGPNLDYAVNSDPDGAVVAFFDGKTCETPCELAMPRANSTRVDFAKEGYEPVSVLVLSKSGASTFGNVLAGGIIGAAVDAGNGSNRFLSPRPLYVRLAKAGSGEEAMLLDKDGEVISTVAAHNDEVREKVAKQIGSEAAGLSEGAVAADMSAESSDSASD